MASPNILQALAAGTNPTADAFNATTNSLQQRRERDFESEQRMKGVQTQDAIDQAIRESAMPAAAPLPQQGQPQAPLPPAQQPVITTQDLMPGAPQAAPSQGLAAAPTSFAGQGQPQQVPNQLSPFDTPEYTANLQRRLASIPGAGNQLLQMKKERDGMIAKVLDMSAAGNVDEARYLARQNGIELPNEMYANGEFARALSLSAKAYPDEPQKAQMFAQAYMSNPGGLQERVNAGIQAGGMPTSASQRQLSNQMALLEWKKANPGVGSASSNPYNRFSNVGNVGLVDLGADGGPRVVIPGQKNSYQDILQKNIEMLGRQIGSSDTPEQLHQKAKVLTDMVVGTQGAGGGGQQMPSPGLMSYPGAELQPPMVNPAMETPRPANQPSSATLPPPPFMAGNQGATPANPIVNRPANTANAPLPSQPQQAIVPKSQQEIDAAPPGTLFNINGQIMRKR